MNFCSWLCDSDLPLLLSFSFFLPLFCLPVCLPDPQSLSCGPPVHKSFINNSVNNVKSIVFSKVVLINMNEFICLHQSMINAHKCLDIAHSALHHQAHITPAPHDISPTKKEKKRDLSTLNIYGIILMVL